MKAMEFYKKSLSIKRKNFGDKHIEETANLNNIAIIFHQ